MCSLCFELVGTPVLSFALRVSCVAFCLSSGNNPTSIVRVLARPSRFGVWDDPVQDTGSPALSSADKWTDNFVWKPTWSRLKPCPPEYRRGAKDVRQRQMLNHLMAVEPLCTKDSLVSVSPGRVVRLSHCEA